MPVVELRHPLVRHKVGLLRDAAIRPKAFREVVRELAALLTYEATADLPLQTVTLSSWSGAVDVERHCAPDLAAVPILRAGLGMLDGVLGVVPTARVAMVGQRRHHVTLQPECYYVNLPDRIGERTALVLDPMLATGGSLIATIDLLIAAGCRDVRALVLVAAPEGIRALQAAHPSVRCWAAAIDRGLNEQGYILPGLGDAGDKLFGTG